MGRPLAYKPENQPNQPVWTRINPNQPESTCINPYKPRSNQINPNQLESTRIHPYQPISIHIYPISIHINPMSTRINPNQPVSTCINFAVYAGSCLLFYISSFMKYKTNGSYMTGKRASYCSFWKRTSLCNMNGLKNIYKTLWDVKYLKSVEDMI